MKKKIIALIVITALTLLSVVGCGTQSTQSSLTTPTDTKTDTKTDTTAQKTKGFTVGVLIGLPPFSWLDQFQEDVKIALEKEKKSGVIADYIMYNTKTDEEANAALNDALNRKVDGVLLLPANEDSISASVGKLTAAGIKVFGQSAYYPGGVRLDVDFTSYRLPTEFVLEEMGGKGNLVEIIGFEGEVSQVTYDKVDGASIAKYPDVKKVARAQGEYDAGKTNKAVSGIISANPKIDGYIGNLGVVGAIRAFQAAKKPLPVMTGDYTMEFFRMWKTIPELKAMAPSYPPGVGYDGIELLVKIMQGKKIKESALTPVPGRTDGAKAIFLPPPLYVVKELKPDAKWMKLKDPRTKVITLDEALKLGEGKADSYCIDGFLSDADINAFFQ